MKKINTILAAVGALLMLTVTSANSMEFKAGVSANGMAAYANAKETLKDSGAVTNEEAILATSFASAFVELSRAAAMGLGSGISYAPEVVDLEKETRTIQNVYGTGDSGANDSGEQIIDGKVQEDTHRVIIKQGISGWFLTTKKPLNLVSEEEASGILTFDFKVNRKSEEPLIFTSVCGENCNVSLDMKEFFGKLSLGNWSTIGVPLKCL